MFVYLAKHLNQSDIQYNFSYLRRIYIAFLIGQDVLASNE